MTSVRLHETTRAPTPTAGRRFEVRIIEADVQGSSGYYPAATLQEAAKARVFHAGLPVYLDHPSVTEAQDRPERSVRDLAGKLGTDAVMRSDGLYAEMQVYPHVAQVVEAFAADVGMSIRAMGTAEQQEADGTTRSVVTAITEALSVDIVTAAGAGGKVTRLLESARKQLGEANASDIGAALSDAVSDTCEDDPTRGAYLVDFDPDTATVYYRTMSMDDMGGDSDLWSQGYTLNPDGTATLTGTPTSVTSRTVYTPIVTDPEPVEEANNPAAHIAAAATYATARAATLPIGTYTYTKPWPVPGTYTTTTTDVPAPAGQPTKEHDMPQIEESLRAQLDEATGRVRTLTDERDAAVQALAQHRARDAARPVAAQVVAEAATPLPAPTATRVVEAAVAAAPLTQDGRLDEAAFRTQVTAARTAAEAEVAAILEASGVGRPRGFGDTLPTPADDFDLDKALDGIFQNGA